MERLLLDARESEPSFSELDEVELRLATDKIILNCSAITGCELPFTELFADTISTSIVSFIEKFEYSDLNVSEVILAMEFNLKHQLRMPSGIELQEVIFVGRCPNISYLSKIMYNYMVIRNNIDRRLQNLIDGYE